MDDRTDKHSANGLRTNAQRTTVNIPIGGIEKLLLSGVFLLLLCWQSKSPFSCHGVARTLLSTSTLTFPLFFVKILKKIYYVLCVIDGTQNPKLALDTQVLHSPY
jgi:hypothetical protein